MATRYKSRYTDKLVTIPQYLAEQMCERIARKNKEELVYQFWNTTKWKRTFLYQLQIANGLLKIYSSEAIINVLKNNPTAFSLNAKFLDPLFAAEQERLDRLEKAEEKIEIPPTPVVDTTQKVRPTFQEGKSTLGKLRGL